MRRHVLSAAAAFGAVAAAAGPAAAHPHVFVDARSEVVFAGGKLAAIRHIWQFDETFTQLAVTGLDANKDGKISDAELAPLAKVNVESLAMFGFFTRLAVDGADAAFVPPSEYWLEFRNGRLTLFYTLPLKTPVAVKTATVQVLDPEYFVGFTYPDSGRVTVDGAPAGCTASFQPPRELDARTMGLLANIPIDQRAIPAPLKAAVDALANKIVVACK
jgi:ABC-type uncharacterized transport system substrate-binding protein